MSTGRKMILETIYLKGLKMDDKTTNCLNAAHRIMDAISRTYDMSVDDIIGNHVRKYLYVKYLIALYLFNKGFRHEEIGISLGVDRTSVYHIIERATDIMRSRDAYYLPMKQCVSKTLEEIGDCPEILNKFV